MESPENDFVAETDLFLPAASRFRSAKEAHNIIKAGRVSSETSAKEQQLQGVRDESEYTPAAETDVSMVRRGTLLKRAVRTAADDTIRVRELAREVSTLRKCLADSEVELDRTMYTLLDPGWRPTDGFDIEVYVAKGADPTSIVRAEDRMPTGKSFERSSVDRTPRTYEVRDFVGVLHGVSWTSDRSFSPYLLSVC